MDKPFNAVCSARPRTQLHSGRQGGNQWWARDPYHVLGEDKRTLCGRDASEWLTIGPLEALNDDCCIRCRKKAGEASRG